MVNVLEKSKKILVGCLLVAVLLLGTFLGGIIFERSGENPASQTISSKLIVNKINNEAFILTKTVFLDQETTIKVEQDSDWSNFWWGQTINARGLIRVDVGVDFSKIKESDITVDSNAKKIFIKLPDATVLDASLSGDIRVESQSGILKFLLANDPNKDHNLALAQLTKDARDTVTNNRDLLNEARSDSIKILNLVLGGLNYSVEIQN